jgi:pilus assembly protein CpaE
MNQGVSVQLKINNQRVAEDLKKIISSMEGFYLRDSEDTGSCDLLIIEIGNNLRKEIHRLHSMTNTGSIREIFMTSANLDPRMVVEARKAGVKKILTQPIKKEEVRKALLKLKENEMVSSPSKENQQSGKIIYIMGCKGGIGTTTVALNLASSLAEIDKSRSVVLTDMTFPFGDMSILLNVKPSPNWAQLGKNISRIDSSLIKSILFEHPTGFFVLPSPSDENGRQGMNPESMEKLLSAMQKGLDFIVIDGGKSLSYVSVKVLKMAELILMVTSANSPCIANVNRLFSILQTIEPSLDEKVRIVLNRYQKYFSIPLEKMEKELNKTIFWKIPNDFQTVTEAINQGKTLCEVGSGRGICKAFRELAALLLGDGKKESEKKGFLRRLTNEPQLLDLALTFDHKPKSA